MMSLRMMTLRLTLSILGLILYLFIFGSVTYAWVTMAQINNIDNLTLIASSGRELLVSTDDENYDTTISLQQLHVSNQLKDVTTSDGIHFTRGGYMERGDAIAQQDYMVIDLYFKSTARERDLFLMNRTFENSNRGTYIESNGINFIPKVHYTEDNHRLVLKDSIIRYYAKDAVRISFGEMDEEGQVQQATIYDPSENEFRGYGKSFGAYSYYLARTNTPLYLPEYTPSIIYGLSELDPANPYQVLDNRSWISRLKPTDETDLNGKTIYKTKIRLCIWIEGWDPDAIDGILNDQLRIQLEFKLAHRAT